MDKFESHKKGSDADTKAPHFRELVIKASEELSPRPALAGSTVRGTDGASCAKVESNMKDSDAGSQTASFTGLRCAGLGGAPCAIYFDNSSTSFPKPPQVAEAVFNAINEMGVPNRSVYPIAINASRMIYLARKSTAELFNAPDISSVAFTSGATESLNTAINGLLTSADHVITTVTEHNSVLRPLYRLGCELSFIPCDSQGNLILDGVKKFIKSKTKAIVVNHISNVTGIAADVSYISTLCRENGLYFIMDCAQSAGSIPIDSSIADVICFTGHKALFGPQGTGGIITAKNLPINPLKVGGTGHNSFDIHHPADMPDRLEAGVQNCHGISGFLAGIEFIKKVSVTKIVEKKLMLTKRFTDGVSQLKNVKLYGDFSRKIRGAVVSLLVDGYTSGELSEILWEKYNIATRPGIHCAPLMHKALNTEKTGLTRFSFSFFNTAGEIDYAIKALSEI